MKKVLTFIVFFLPWLLSGLLFNCYTGWYETIKLPFFALPKVMYMPIWLLLYALIAYTSTKIWHQTLPGERKEYLKTLGFNYLFNQLFLFFFFFLKNTFLGFVDVVLVLITSLFLYYETKELNKTSAKMLLPYVFYNLYALILSLFIYFINL